MEQPNLEIEVKALRRILERLLAFLPEDYLERSLAEARSSVAHLEGGGQTMPPSDATDIEAARVELGYYEEVSSRVAEWNWLSSPHNPSNQGTQPD